MQLVLGMPFLDGADSLGLMQIVNILRGLGDLPGQSELLSARATPGAYEKTSLKGHAEGQPSLSAGVGECISHFA